MAAENEGIGIIVVDVQGDFTRFKNGSLAVEGTDEAYIKKVDQSTQKLKNAGFPLFATQDWHPPRHTSFYTNHKGRNPFDVIRLGAKEQVLWPPHCVQGSRGADILLDERLFQAIVKKGTDPRYDSYSGFQDDGGKKTNLDRILKQYKIKKVVVYGIATDYCVRATALDAAALRYKVVLIKGLCRGVAPDTSKKAIAEMKAKGISILTDLDMKKLKAG
ncbi:MAG: amidase [Deltaproteobacteria bacterium RBG_13_53_10]|nr:MAG: amidase [Deltaproteobacteria bacterium RBG_13_53_10]